MNIFSKYLLFLFLALSFISYSPIAQTSNPTSESATKLYFHGNMMEANMQYGALLSVEPENPDYQYYYAVTCTADSALRLEGINRLKALDSDDLHGGERLFFLGLAYHHSSDYFKAIQVFKRAEKRAVKKSVWLAELQFRLIQCEAALSAQSSSINLSRHSSVSVSSEDFFRSISTVETPYRMVLVPSELRTRYDHKMGWVSPVAFDSDADLLYFSSYGKKGDTGLDIYSAKILEDGSLDYPVRLSDKVNSVSDEINPFFHSLSSTLIFASNRQASLGGYDIFSSQVVPSSNTYLKCAVFHPGINSPLNEFGYYPLGDLEKGWLISDKSGHFSETILSEITVDFDVAIVSEMESVINTEEPDAAILALEIEPVEHEVSMVVTDSVIERLETNTIAELKEPELQSLPLSDFAPNLSLQIGVFSNKPDVSQLPFGFNLFTLILPNGMFKVFAGPYESEDERAEFKKQLVEAGFKDIFNVVAKPSE